MQIQEGDTFRFNIDFTGATPNGPYSFISWHVNTAFSDGFNLGDKLSVALYDDANPGTALGSGVFNWNTFLPDFSYGSLLDANPAFDGTGYLEFNMISGSIDLTGGYVLIYDNGVATANGLTDITVMSHSSVSVPEPNTLYLFALALGLIAVVNGLKNWRQVRSIQPIQA